jgi:cytochrome c oxidase cbb3-type subunit III
MAAKPDYDDVTGVETTGHEWDGLKELNKPLPSWWVWTFWVTIIWAVGYWIAYPAWPMVSGYTAGYLGFSSRQAALDDVKAGRAVQKDMNDALAKTSISDMRSNAKLFDFAVKGGAVIFADNCAACHGRGAQGAPGFPNLNDDKWIWGGKITDINYTVTHGIRSGASGERNNQMPRFGLDKMLNAQQISDVADFVLSLSGGKADEAVVGRGKAIFAENCVACHGEGAKGNQELGAPNLTDKIWLYGGTKADIVKQVETGRGGVMPSWAGRLDADALKKVTAYVWSRGGGVK